MTSTRRPWAATGYSIGHVLLAVPIALLVAVTSVGVALLIVGVGVFVLRALIPGLAAIARTHAAMAGSFLGEPIGMAEPVAAAGAGPARQLLLWAGDASVWRLVAWLFWAVSGGLVMSVLVLMAPLGAIALVVLPIVFLAIDAAAHVLLAVIMLPSAVVVALGWWFGADQFLRWRCQTDAAILGPDPNAVLTQRVADLTASRADTVDHSAAELRRIERDLHDGAQARLVALGMNLGLLADLMERDPVAARQLLDEARSTTGAALGDLRSVVRGIHPPVLADRGLIGAVQALALDMAVPVTVDAALPSRPPAPVESALYFAVAECLANIGKHSGAGNGWIVIAGPEERVRVVVGDDGRGGARLDTAGGLGGMARRLAAFDGTMVVDSPHGGPTIVTLEVPCAWSSPRTTPSSATG